MEWLLFLPDFKKIGICRTKFSKISPTTHEIPRKFLREGELGQLQARKWMDMTGLGVTFDSALL